MCGRISNLVRDVRHQCTLPNGRTIDPDKLDKHFESISHQQRGEISRRVLAALPKQEGIIVRDEMRKSLGKKTPLDQPVLELGVFLALGHHAIENGTTIPDIVAMIETQRSGAGIILRAA